MKTGEKKLFILVPQIGLIEAGKTMKDTMDRINRAECDQELADKRMLRQLKKENPGCIIEKFGEGWMISPKDKPLKWE